MPLIAKFATQLVSAIGRCLLPNKFTGTKSPLPIVLTAGLWAANSAAATVLSRINAASRLAFTWPTVALFTLSIHKRRRSVWCITEKEEPRLAWVVTHFKRRLIA